MLTEIKPGAIAFGSRRFLVRGTHGLTLPQSDALIITTQELPERYPLEPQFPQAGRRSGSRPPSRAGAEPAAPGEEAGAPGVAFPPGNYPGPRPRGDLPPLQISGQMPPSTGSQYSDLCPAPQGEILSFGRNISIAQSPFVETSRVIPYAFLINHIMWHSTSTTVNNPTVEFFIDVQVDTGTTRTPTGTPIISPFSRRSNMEAPTGAFWESYPNRKVPQANMVIAVAYRTNDAANTEFDVTMDISPL